MEKIADHGNGHYAYIDTLLEARKVLVEEVGATLFTVAKDVKLQVEFNPTTVQAYRLLGYENRLLADEDFNDDKKDAGDLGAGHAVTALYEVIPAGIDAGLTGVDELKYQENVETPEARGSGEVLTVKVRYKQPDAAESQLLSQRVPFEDAEVASAPEDFRFAAAVAEFGILLRGSPHKAEATYEQVLELADGSATAQSNDPRFEFLYLVRTARRLSAEPTVSQLVSP
jgi:Ca-activated chloride channel family protein